MANAAEIGWLAGMVEGEGCLYAAGKPKSFTPAITLSSTDRDVIERVAKFFKAPVRVQKTSNPWTCSTSRTPRSTSTASRNRRRRPGARTRSSRAVRRSTAWTSCWSSWTSSSSAARPAPARRRADRGGYEREVSVRHVGQTRRLFEGLRA